MSTFGFRIPDGAGAMLRSRAGPAGAVVMTLAALAGCAQGPGTATGKAQEGTSGPPAAAQSPSSTAGLPLPAMTQAQHASLGALAYGKLILGGGCFYLTSLVSTKQMDLVWPYGFTAGPAGIYDGHGTLVARPGEDISLGGGSVILAHVPPKTITNTQCLTGATTAWFIGSVGH